MFDLVYDYDKNAYVERIVLALEAANSGQIKKVFDTEFKNVNFDSRLYKAINHYCNDIFTKEYNIEWFGSSLLGTQLIRFYSTDSDRLFDDVLVVDEDMLADALTTTDAKLDYKVGGNTFNLTIAYLVHRLINIKNDKLAYQAGVNLIKLLQFKFYSSVYSDRFGSKPVDMPAAEGAYAALSMKFAIKTLGTWGAIVEERAEYFMSKNNPQYAGMVKFLDSDDINKFISAINTRTRQTINDYYNVLDMVRSDNSRINTTSNKITIDGATILKDKVTVYNNALRNLLESSSTLTSFYIEQLAAVALEMVPKASPTAFKTMMEYISSLQIGKERREIDKIMETTISHAFDYVYNNRVNFTDVALLLEKLRGLYTAPKANSEEILYLRSSLEKIIKKHTHLRYDVALAALRNALLLYFILRSLYGINN